MLVSPPSITEEVSSVSNEDELQQQDILQSGTQSSWNSRLSEEQSCKKNAMRLWFLILLCGACGVRGLDVFRPIDGTVWESWRETDVAAISRNFYREGMNICYPRIDWRGNGPGYVESEFPLHPWLIAAAYRSFGYHEEYLRVLSFLAGCFSCLIFFRFARDLLGPVEGIAASLIFACSPLAIRLSSAVQPEPMMFCLSLLAVDQFWRWTVTSRSKHYWSSLFSTTLAILVKLTSAHIGILFAFLCVRRWKLRAFLRWDLWGFVLLALGIPLFWYWHAHSIWLEFGNSLGISNEAFRRISSGSFWINLMETFAGNWELEQSFIWMTSGTLLGVAGLLSIVRKQTATLPLFWLIALICYYIVTGRTSGEGWASYYHIASLPVASLLIAQGFCFLWKARLSKRMTLRSKPVLAQLLKVTAVVCFVWVLFCDFQLWHQERSSLRSQRKYETAVAFRKHVPTGALIVTSTESRFDQHGIPRAIDAPYYFYWLDSKGFTLPVDEMSVSTLRSYHRAGADWFVLERSHLADVPELETECKRHFECLSETSAAVLFSLKPYSEGNHTQNLHKHSNFPSDG